MMLHAMEIGEVYFYTSTINKWKHLLQQDEYKDIVIQSLKHLVDRNLIQIYAFVLMPNHVHLIWELKRKNGKEMPHASFSKFTAHEFLKKLRKEAPTLLNEFNAVRGNTISGNEIACHLN